mmetsp:Transcript_60312/g.155365  ORF Transcript_60312/g.155365 Transcript_60312/m.155365 type:complete len:323 (-) Transcript_60312:282-1250(-)
MHAEVLAVVEGGALGAGGGHVGAAFEQGNDVAVLHPHSGRSVARNIPSCIHQGHLSVARHVDRAGALWLLVACWCCGGSFGGSEGCAAAIFRRWRCDSGLLCVAQASDDRWWRQPVVWLRYQAERGLLHIEGTVREEVLTSIQAVPHPGQDYAVSILAGHVDALGRVVLEGQGPQAVGNTKFCRALIAVHQQDHAADCCDALVGVARPADDAGLLAGGHEEGGRHISAAGAHLDVPAVLKGHAGDAEALVGEGRRLELSSHVARVPTCAVDDDEAVAEAVAAKALLGFHHALLVDAENCNAQQDEDGNDAGAIGLPKRRASL